MQRNLTKTQNKSLCPVNNYEDKKNLVPEILFLTIILALKQYVCVINNMKPNILIRKYYFNIRVLGILP